MTGLLRETLELGFYDRRRRRTKELRGRSPAGGAVDRFKIGDPSRHACFARNAPEPKATLRALAGETGEKFRGIQHLKCKTGMRIGAASCALAEAISSVGRIASMCSGRDSLDGSSRERLVSEDEIRAEIYSHTDHFHIEGEQPFFPANRDERNILPAFNITTVAETRSRNIEPQRATYRQEIISNVAPL